MSLGVVAGALAVLAATTLAGYAVVRFFGDDLSLRERLGWSIAVGAGGLSVLSVILIAVHLQPGPKKFAAALSLLLLGSFLLRRPGRASASVRRPEGASILPSLLLLAALAALLVFAVEAVQGGMWAREHVAIWGLKAKTIFATASFPPRLFGDSALAASHPEPPLFFPLYPLSLGSVAWALRNWDGHALAWLDVAFALATVLVVSGFLARRVSPIAGGVGGVLVALCAPLYSTANVGTTQILLGLGLTLVGTASLDVLERESAPACARLFLASALCAATDPRGAFFVVLLLGALLARGIAGRALPRVAALALLLGLSVEPVASRLLRGPLAQGPAWEPLRAGFSALASRLPLLLLRLGGVESRLTWLAIVAFGSILILSRRGVGDPLLWPAALQIAAAAAIILMPADPPGGAASGVSAAVAALFPLLALVAVSRVLPQRDAGPSRGLGWESRRAFPFPSAAALGLLVLLLLVVPSTLQSAAGEKRLGLSAPRPTFHATIEPILQARCQTCHHAGGIGPFALTSFDDAESQSRSILRQVVSRQMPPWKADEACGRFANDSSLSEAEIAAVARWVEGGTAEGDSRDAPAAQKFSDDWQLGKPDLVLKAPEFTPDFSHGDVYQCFAVPTGLDTDRWVAAVEVKPGNRAMVHHALLSVEEGIRSRDFDEEAPGPGYPCFGGPRAPVTDSFGEWTPGMQPRYFPPGVARFLPRKSRIIMQIHYSALFGRVAPDHSEVGVYFAKEPATRRLLSDAVRADGPFVIPAGAVSHALHGRIGPLASRSELIAILPHMHLLGQTMRVTARLPDGSMRCLVDVEDWDLRWQRTYFYEKPVVLPAGTRIELDATFDNSYANPRNPNQPPRDVVTGEHTTDEMCMAVLFWTVDGKNPGERDAFFRNEVCGAGPTPTPTPASR